jgi:hypothetical protein
MNRPRNSRLGVYARLTVVKQPQAETLARIGAALCCLLLLTCASHGPEDLQDPWVGTNAEPAVLATAIPLALQECEAPPLFAFQAPMATPRPMTNSESTGASTVARHPHCGKVRFKSHNPRTQEDGEGEFGNDNECASENLPPAASYDPAASPQSSNSDSFPPPAAKTGSTGNTPMQVIPPDTRFEWLRKSLQLPRSRHTVKVYTSIAQ